MIKVLCLFKWHWLPRQAKQLSEECLLPLFNLQFVGSCAILGSGPHGPPALRTFSLLGVRDDSSPWPAGLSMSGCGNHV